MINKFPTGQSFQRLANKPLDETVIFDTLIQAEDYAKNNPTAHKGQIIHIKDARTEEEIENNINIYEETCYIDLLHNIIPICSFTYKALVVFFDLMYEIINGPTDETKIKLDTLKEIMYKDYTHDFNEIPTGDYHTQPWHPANYNDYQICIELSQGTSDLIVGKYSTLGNFNSMTIEGANYTVENFQVQDENGIKKYYKVVSLDSFPTRISFDGGTFIKKVIHMCNTSNITTMQAMFFQCFELTELDVSNFDTSKVTDISNMFTRCKVLTTIKGLNNFNTSNVTNVSWLFQDCSALTTLNCSGWDLSKITYMQDMFKNCSSLIELDINNWNVSNVTRILDMFSGCSSLMYLNIDNCDMSNVMNTAGMFYNCIALTLDNIIMTNCSESTITKITDAYNYYFG